jgi:hypothetical protein
MKSLWGLSHTGNRDADRIISNLIKSPRTKFIPVLLALADQNLSLPEPREASVWSAHSNCTPPTITTRSCPTSKQNLHRSSEVVVAVRHLETSTPQLHWTSLLLARLVRGQHRLYPAHRVQRYQQRFNVGKELDTSSKALAAAPYSNACLMTSHHFGTTVGSWTS